MRQTQLRIDCLKAQMNRRSSDGQDSDSSASRSTSRGSTTPRPPTDPPLPRPPPPTGSPLHTPQWTYVGETNTHLPLGKGRRRRRNTLMDEDTRFPPEGETPPSETDPSPIGTFRVTISRVSTQAFPLRGARIASAATHWHIPGRRPKGKVAARASDRQRHSQDPRDKLGRTEDRRQRGQKRSKYGPRLSTDSRRTNPHRFPKPG